jgi:hypothetical protein
MKRFLALSVIILVCAGFCLGAEDWIFKVPVKLKNICPEYTGFRVYCLVYNGPNYTYENELGGGWGYVYASPSQYKGDVDRVVTVKASHDQGKDPALGTHYKCFLTGTWQNDNTKGRTFEEIYNIKPDCVYKPGTVFTASYHGPLQ